MSSNAPASSSSANNDKNKPKTENQPADVNKPSLPQLGALEEDDEFEEFPAEDWNEAEEDPDTHLWEDNWDDDNIEDDFSKQLKAELQKQTQPQPMKM